MNELLAERPEIINEDAYGKGWICLIRLSDQAEMDALLDADAYAALVENEVH